MSTRVKNAVGAYLVGGLKAPDAEAAMRTTAGILGRHLYALTDGETGERSEWTQWQVAKLSALDGVELPGAHGDPGARNKEQAQFRALAVDPSVTCLPARALGYADAAERSYTIFRRLRDEGVVPDGVKFQVSLPTPYATVLLWVRPEDQQRFLPVYADALEQETREIVRIVGDDLMLQYDVAVEVALLEGGIPAGGDLGDESVVLQAFRDVFARTPAGVQCAVHLCYGDYQHRHFAAPQDLSVCVRLAQAVSERVAFVHMPADRDTGRDPRYFEPLRDLTVNRLALGVIDYEGDEQRCHELADAAFAGSGGMEFAAATECGMARIDQRGPGGPSLEHLLRLHARTAAPIR
jgi:hypothetical protein